jgi:hypothetical protein
MNNVECQVGIGQKGQTRPCGLPTWKNDLCRYHWWSLNAKQSLQRRKKIAADNYAAR